MGGFERAYDAGAYSGNRDFTCSDRRARPPKRDSAGRCTPSPFSPGSPCACRNYAVNPHDGYRYWYDYFEQFVEGRPFKADGAARYRAWYDDFPGTGTLLPCRSSTHGTVSIHGMILLCRITVGSAPCSSKLERGKEYAPPACRSSHSSTGTPYRLPTIRNRCAPDEPDAYRELSGICCSGVLIRLYVVRRRRQSRGSPLSA